ncbi:MAG: Uncharacterised protein [Flavobacteriaceae bacterium]|nr:MAG: Uncharacterised protein [Flavobacteriaceae bacterium]
MGISRDGFLDGSPIIFCFPFLNIAAPGKNSCKERASKSRYFFAAGYAVNNTWNPRSKLYPSIISVFTLPPSLSEASMMVGKKPCCSKTVAAIKPLIPPPMICISGTLCLIISYYLFLKPLAQKYYFIECEKQCLTFYKVY